MHSKFKMVCYSDFSPVSASDRDKTVVNSAIKTTIIVKYISKFEMSGKWQLLKVVTFVFALFGRVITSRALSNSTSQT